MTSSSAGRYGQHGLSAYGASKSAVDGLVRTLASEGAGRGIAVNAVSPYALSQMTAAHIRGEMAEGFTPDRVAPLGTGERRVGKECGSEGKARSWRYN